MVIAVAREHVAAARVLLKAEGELAYEIGFVEAGNPGEPEAMVL
jgi:phosphoribosylaminoimidazole (AIR) synthetase